MAPTLPRSLVFIVAAMLTWPTGPAAQPATDPEAATVDALLDAALTENRAWDLLADLTKTAPHRLSGSQGNLDAVQWGKQALEQLGLDQVRTQAVTVPHWVRGDIGRVEVVEDGSTVAMVALGASVGTRKKGIEAQLVTVESFEELEALGREGVKGKIVLYTVKMDPTLPSPFSAYGQAVRYRWGGASAASALGAKAVLVRSMTIKRDDIPHGGGMGYSEGVRPIPAAAVSWLGAERLSELAARPQGVKVRLTMTSELLPDAESANVIGDIKGSERPDEVVVLSCHLDSWDLGQNAHDDGAGCVHVIEAMRLIRELGWKPQRTIRALLYANEENGGRGARAYAEQAAQASERIVLALESDRGGYFPLGLSTPSGPQWERILAKALVDLAPIYADRVVQGYSGADVRRLEPLGVATGGLLVAPQRYFDMHHSESDRLDDVHPRELALGAVVFAWTAYQIAELQEELPMAPIPDEP